MLKSPTPVMNPRPAEIQNAIDILAVMGSGKGEAKKLLEDMLAVQKYNDEIFSKATEAKKEAEDVINKSVIRMEEINKRKKEFEEHRTTELRILSGKYNSFSTEKSDARYNIKKTENSMSILQDKLDAREKLLNEHVVSLNKKEKDADEKEKACNALAVSLRFKENKLQDIFSKLRNILPK